MRLCLALLAVLATACVHVAVGQTVRMDRSAFPLHRDSVAVMTLEDTIPETCDLVAELETGRGYNPLLPIGKSGASPRHREQELRRSAGRLGANVIQMQWEGPGVSPNDEGDALAYWCPDGLG